MPSIQTMMKEDFLEDFQKLAQENIELKTKNNILDIRISKMRKEMNQKENIIKSYRRMITGLTEKLTKVTGIEKHRNSSQLIKISTEESLIGSPCSRKSSVGNGFKLTCPEEPSPNISLSGSKGRKGFNLGDVQQLFSLKKYVEIKRVNSIEPCFREIIQTQSLYQLFRKSVVQIKKLINCKSLTVYIFDKRVIKFSQVRDAKIVRF